MKRVWPLLLACLGLAWPGGGRAQMESLFRPSDAEHRAITGWDQRYPGVPGWVPDNIWQQTFNRKYLKLAPGERYTLAEIQGPGILSRIFFAVPVRFPENNLRALVLRIYWDGEDNPSVLAPLGDFFGAPFGRYRDYDAMPMSMQGGGMVCRFPMPFRHRARIELENGWPDKSAGVFFGIGWYQAPDLPDDALYFHAHWRRVNPTIKGEPYLVEEMIGRGNYVGLQLFLQNRSRFVGKGLFRLMQPEGFGLGNLEGWEEIEVDGDLVQHGTGTEEYFNAGAYFVHTPYSGIFEGVRMRSYFTGRLSAYRFQVLDPIPFQENFRMIWHHGPLDAIRGDYASIAYWYQTEPHAELTLPDRPGRLPSGTAAHSAQALLLAPLVYGNKLANALLFKD